jgi:hypothetical protein
VHARDSRLSGRAEGEPVAYDSCEGMSMMLRRWAASNGISTVDVVSV